MKVNELNREQLIQLKQNYYCHLNGDTGMTYGEFISIDELVSDITIFSEYGGTEFVEEDFWG